MLVLGVDNALAWRDTNPLYVIGGVLLGGLAGEALDIEDRLARVGEGGQGGGGRGGRRGRALAPHGGRHGRLPHLARAALGAGEVAPRREVVEGLGGCEPALEAVALRAPEAVADHRPFPCLLP